MNHDDNTLSKDCIESAYNKGYAKGFRDARVQMREIVRQIERRVGKPASDRDTLSWVERKERSAKVADVILDFVAKTESVSRSDIYRAVQSVSPASTGTSIQPTIDRLVREGQLQIIGGRYHRPNSGPRDRLPLSAPRDESRVESFRDARDE